MKLNANFQHLPKTELIESYRVSNRRLIFLDYEGTLQVDTGEESMNIQDLSPPNRLIKLLTSLSNDSRNAIFIVTGREKSTVDEWFGCNNHILIYSYN
jgi:trehalose 6-phosphate synthase/phosphatase